MKKNKKVVAVNVNKLLPYSETFIKNHIEYNSEFIKMVFASEQLSDGLQVSVEKKLIIKNHFLGGIQDIFYKIGLISPMISQFFIDNKVDIIHSHFGQNGYAAAKIAKKINVAHITTFHGLDITLKDIDPIQHGILLKKFRSNINYLIESGDLFIAVSEFIRLKLISEGFPQDKVITHFLGIDTNKFEPDDSEKHKKIVCVARHVEYKGIQYLINAFKEIELSHPDWELVLIGDGVDTSKLMAYASEIDCSVTFKGRLSQREIWLELNSAAIYCQPSIKLNNGHEEALALTIVEAQSMGVPAVVFDSGGMKEAINPNISGLVAKEANVGDLSEKILTLIENKAMRVAFSREAYAFAREKHCINKQSKSLDDIYIKLLEKRK